MSQFQRWRITRAYYHEAKLYYMRLIILSSPSSVSVRKMSRLVAINLVRKFINL